MTTQVTNAFEFTRATYFTNKRLFARCMYTPFFIPRTTDRRAIIKAKLSYNDRFAITFKRQLTMA